MFNIKPTRAAWITQHLVFCYLLRWCHPLMFSHLALQNASHQSSCSQEAAYESWGGDILLIFNKNIWKPNFKPQIIFFNCEDKNGPSVWCREILFDTSDDWNMNFSPTSWSSQDTWWVIVNHHINQHIALIYLCIYATVHILSLQEDEKCTNMRVIVNNMM